MNKRTVTMSRFDKTNTMKRPHLSTHQQQINSTMCVKETFEKINTKKIN